MRNSASRFVVFAALVAAIAFSAPAFAKGSKPTLPAPTNVVANINCIGDSLDASWDAVTGATKYSIEVTVEYNTLSLTDCSSTNDTVVYSFDSVTNSISIDLSNFLVDFGNGGSQGPCVFDSVCVKALNPPQPKTGSQNNPFGCAPSVGLVNCVV